MSAFFVLYPSTSFTTGVPHELFEVGHLFLQILVLNRKQTYFRKGTSRLSCRFESQVGACQIKNRIAIRSN